MKHIDIFCLDLLLDLGIHDSIREPTGTQFFVPPGYRFDDRKNIVLNDNIDKIIKIYNSILWANKL